MIRQNEELVNNTTTVFQIKVISICILKYNIIFTRSAKITVALLNHNGSMIFQLEKFDNNNNMTMRKFDPFRMRTAMIKTVFGLKFVSDRFRPMLGEHGIYKTWCLKKKKGVMSFIPL